MTFSWSSSSWFSLLFSSLFLSGFSGSWLFSSGWLFFLLLLSWSLIKLSTSSFIGLLGSFFLDSNFEVSLNLIEEIFTKSALQHLRSFGINIDFVGLDFGLFWNPIESSFSFFLLDFKRNSLNGAFLDSLD